MLLLNMTISGADRPGQRYAAGAGRVVEGDRVAVGVGRRAAADGPVRRAGVPGRAWLPVHTFAAYMLRSIWLPAGLLTTVAEIARGHAADQQRAALKPAGEAAVAHDLIGAAAEAAGVLDVDRGAVERQGAGDRQQVAAARRGPCRPRAPLLRVSRATVNVPMPPKLPEVLSPGATCARALTVTVPASVPVPARAPRLDGRRADEGVVAVELQDAAADLGQAAAAAIVAE